LPFNNRRLLPYLAALSVVFLPASLNIQGSEKQGACDKFVGDLQTVGFCPTPRKLLKKFDQNFIIEDGACLKSD